MKKTLLLFLTVLFAFSYSVKADVIVKHWTPVGGYQHNMTMTGVITIDGVEQYSNTLELGAFCGDECRGSELAIVDEGRYYYMPVILGAGESQETIHFRIYDHSTSQELELTCPNTIPFVIDANHGDFDNPYIVAFNSGINITATVNPVGAGTVTGAGLYQPNESVTIEASENDDYWFMNWTESGNWLTDNHSYSFTAEIDRSFVANFKQKTHHWTPITGAQYNMNVLGIILINNVEQFNPMLEVGAFCGDECRGSDFATYDPVTQQYVVPLTILSDEESGDVITFALYDHRNEVELDVFCLSQLEFVNDAIIGMSDEWYHFEFGSLCQITVTIDPAATGVVEGVGGHYWGTMATLTAVANEGYAFWKWLDSNSSFLTYDNPYEFLVTGNMHFIAKFNDQQISPLVAGWNWWSTYIEQEGNDGLSILENSLGENGVIIKNSTSFVRYYSNTGLWNGSLTVLRNEESYLINVTTDCNAIMSGRLAVPSDHPITINPNWTWIGYPVTTEQTPTDAMNTFDPENNDLVKTQNGFAIHRANGWFPNTFKLVPGLGYKYYSSATVDKTLVYSETNRGGGDISEEKHYWNANNNSYTNNICVIATAYILDEEQRDGNLEVGAFVNGECRGTSHLLYYEPLDRYFALIAVSGENGDVVEFALVDTDNNKISNYCMNDIVFASDDIVGNLDEPFEIRFSEMNDINAGSLVMFPNPVERNKSFTMNVPNDEVVKEMVITNAIGAVVKVETRSTKIMQEGLSVSGVYMVKAICESGNIFVGKLIVK